MCGEKFMCKLFFFIKIIFFIGYQGSYLYEIKKREIFTIFFLSIGEELVIKIYIIANK